MTQADPAVVYNNQIVCAKGKGGKVHCKGKAEVVRATTKVAIAAIPGSSAVAIHSRPAVAKRAVKSTRR
jgi:hypothetical protein